MGNQVVGLDVQIKVDQALAELKRLSPGADKEAKAIVGTLNKSLKDAEKQAAKVGDAMKAATTKTASIGDAAGKTGSNVMKLAGALSMVSPAAGGMAQNVADLADVVEVASVVTETLGVSMGSLLAVAGPVAVAIGGLYLAYQSYNAELEASQALEAASIRQLEATSSLASKVTSDRNALAVAIGTMSKSDADAAKVHEDYTAALAAANKELIASKKALEDQYQAAVNDTTNRKDDIVALRGQIAAKQREIQTNTDLAKQGEENALAVIEYNDAKAQSEQVLRERQDAAAKSAQRRAEAERAAAEAVAKATAANERYTSTLASIDDIGHAAQVAQMDAYGRLADEAQRKIDDIEQRGRQAVASAIAAGADGAKAQELVEQHAADARAAVWNDYYANLDELRAKDLKAEQDAQQAATDEAIAAQRARAEAALNAVNTVGGYASQALAMLDDSASTSYQHSADMASALTDQLAAGEQYYTQAQQVELQARIGASKDAARKQFAAAKAAKLAEAAASTALAVINAIAESPPPSPFGIAGSLIAGAAGAASMAAIAAQEPTFHQGYAPDEMQAKVLKTEAVLSPAATSALGAGNIAAANAGVTRGQGAATAPVVFRHQTFRPFIKDFLTQPSALTDALNRTNRRSM
ncbi:hypothetical protein [Janthinobacterium sp.]|uniref:hypothetical protein n=1 Tax=Janthinobacterium sp. TaxID=1871054 RepID=UPI0025C016D0|nr:hypothetical protein [Janthinobacterium sp.]NBV20148.1 hypothetical protein [Janthinobacterium sp.]